MTTVGQKRKIEVITNQSLRSRDDRAIWKEITENAGVADGLLPKYVVARVLKARARIENAPEQRRRTLMKQVLHTAGKLAADYHSGRVFDNEGTLHDDEIHGLLYACSTLLNPERTGSVDQMEEPPDFTDAQIEAFILHTLTLSTRDERSVMSAFWQMVALRLTRLAKSQVDFKLFKATCVHIISEFLDDLEVVVIDSDGEDDGEEDDDEGEGDDEYDAETTVSR